MNAEEIRSANALADKYAPKDECAISRLALTPAERERLMASGKMGMRPKPKYAKPPHDNRGKFKGKQFIAPAAVALAIAERARGVRMKQIALNMRVSVSSLQRAIRAYEQSPACKHSMKQGRPAQSA